MCHTCGRQINIYLSLLHKFKSYLWFMTSLVKYMVVEQTFERWYDFDCFREKNMIWYKIFDVVFFRYRLRFVQNITQGFGTDPCEHKNRRNSHFEFFVIFRIFGPLIRLRISEKTVKNPKIWNNYYLISEPVVLFPEYMLWGYFVWNMTTVHPTYQ